MSKRTPVIYPAFLVFAALIVFLGSGHASGLFNRVPAPKTGTRAEATQAALSGDEANEARSAQAKNFVQSMGDRVIAYILDANLTENARKKKLETVLMQNFDTYTISRFALGQYWRSLSAEEQKEYQDLFADMIVAIYSRKFSDYDGQQFNVNGVRESGPKDYIVQSVIHQKNARDIPVGWHLREENGKFQIVDVTVENVSMIVTQKSQFASIIQRRGGDPSVIIDHLREKLNEAG